MLEEMEPFATKARAEFVRGLERELVLRLPRESNRLDDPALLDPPAGLSADANFGRRGDELREMIRDDVLFQFLASRKNLSGGSRRSSGNLSCRLRLLSGRFRCRLCSFDRC